MAGKHGLVDLDPDYEDLAAQQAKRQRVIEQDGQQASVEAIRRIVQTQFRVELENKESEAREADKRLNEARIMMDRLRAVVVASFYSRQQLEEGKNPSLAPPPSIHPTAKKHLGKAPATLLVKTEPADDICVTTSVVTEHSDPGVSYSKSMHLERNISATSVAPAAATTTPAAVPPRAATTQSREQDAARKEDDSHCRLTTKRTIIVGNSSRFILPHQRQSKNLSTHKWMVYIRGPRDSPDISDIVSRVWFFLHPSYRPHDLVEVREPPFHLARWGWGEFPVRVQLHFRDPRNKRMDIIHNLKLDHTYTGLQTLGAETVVAVDLVRDPIPVTGRPKAAVVSTPSDNVIIEATVKQEPGEEQIPEPQSTEVRCQGLDNSGSVTTSQDTGIADKSHVERQRTNKLDSCVRIKEEPPDDYETNSSQNSVPPCDKSGYSDNGRISVQKTCEGLTTAFANNEEHALGVPRYSKNTSGDATSDCGATSIDLPKESTVSGQVKTSHSFKLSEPREPGPRQNTFSLLTSNIPTNLVTLSSPITSTIRSTVSQIAQGTGSPHTADSSAGSVRGVQVVDAAGSQGGSNGPTPAKAAAPAMKVVLLDSKQVPRQCLITGTSLLPPTTDQQLPIPAYGKPVSAARMPLMKVTSKGLRPFTPTVQAQSLQTISAQSVCGRGPGVVHQGGGPRPPGSLTAQRPSSPCVSLSTAGRGRGEKVTFGNVQQTPGMRSLLSTAVKPEVQSLLQKSNVLAGGNRPTASVVSPGQSCVMTPGQSKILLMKVDGQAKKKEANSAGSPVPVTVYSLLHKSQPAPSPPSRTNPPTRAALHTAKPSTSHTLAARPDVYQGYKSRAGMELAWVKAMMQGQGSQGQGAGLMSKAAAQLARLKLAATRDPPQVEAPQPKSRSAKWFRQGLGAALDPEPVENAAAELAGSDMPDSPGVMTEADAPGKEGRDFEKKIMVIKKPKAPPAVDVQGVVFTVASLSVKEYSCLWSLVKAAVMRHPLLAPACEKATHPYSAVSLHQWIDWHPAKRSAAEWTRAAAVRRYLKRHLGSEQTFKGEQLWSTKRIMHWCRLHGFSPNGPGGRLLEEASEEIPVSDAGGVSYRPAHPTDFHALYSHFQHDVKKEDDDDANESDDYVEVMEMDCETPKEQTRAVKIEPGLQGSKLDFDVLPPSEEAVYVQETAKQLGVRFSPSILAPGVFASTAEDMLFAAMLDFAGDILHHACSFTLSPGRRRHTITSVEVLQALKTLPAASFLIHQHCGIPNPPSPTKR